MQSYLLRLLDPLARLIDACWEPVTWFVLHAYTRALLAYAVAFTVAGFSLHRAWHSYDNAPNVEPPGLRNDGNSGHATIDFGGQYLMGAMLVSGNGHHLYDRTVQRKVLEQNYKVEDQDPRASEYDYDVNAMMRWVMGGDHPETLASFVAPLGQTSPLEATLAVAAGQPDGPDAARKLYHKNNVGGPLYPPVNAFFYAPLALLEVHRAYRLNQILNLVWVFAAGFGFQYWSRQQIWAPVAASFLMAYPGFTGTLHLGQNAALTLCVVVWGWALIARDRPVLGGVVWGLLAFKPVWGAAFFLVPFLTFRWRVCFAMVLTGASLAAATLPFVGLHSWFDWLQVGGIATELYKQDHHWIYLSRDLLSMPRRFLNDFTHPKDHNTPEAEICSWVLYASCLLLTAFMPLWRTKQAPATAGPVAAFLLFGAWMSCFHFMYYDALLSSVGLAALLIEPRQLLEPLGLTTLPKSLPSELDVLTEEARPVPVIGWTWPYVVALVLALPALLVLVVSPFVLLTNLSFKMKLNAYWNAGGEELFDSWLFGQDRTQQLLVAGTASSLVLASGLAAWLGYRLARRSHLVRVPPQLLGYERAVLPYRYPLPVVLGGRKFRSFWVLNRAGPFGLALLLFIENTLPQFWVNASITGPWNSQPIKLTTSAYTDPQPLDSYTVMALWLWCAVVWAFTPRKPKPAASPAAAVPAEEFVELGPDVRGGHEGFAHEDRADAGRFQA